MSRTEWIMTAVVGSYLTMPHIVEMTYYDRGYFAIGGEWLIPVHVAAAAWLLYEIRRPLANAALLIAAALVISIRKAVRLLWSISKAVFKNVAAGLLFVIYIAWKLFKRARKASA